MSDTWTCHVCKDERPDNKIDVFSAVGVLKGRVEVQINVRYCNDRSDCIAGAPGVAAQWRERMEGSGT